ncbi:MAG: THUMP domain-containing protein [Bacteroidota bacterium]|nr:THUMP domain-containing protein [Bacteroidota bacterium]MDP4205489.1 THUMP domain-containing protein [Bacteroidota bacterium]
MKNEKFVAKTFAGLEPILAEELKSIGAENITSLVRAVSFTGDKEVLYKANFYLRTALRVFKEIASFTVTDQETLYKGAFDVPWDDYFTQKQTIAVSSTLSGDTFTNSMFISLKVKDAIVDSFRNKFGKRPSVNSETPDVPIHVHISDKKCTLSLDSSGESLHKRGYRLAQNEAPLNEVLAAGMILLSGWKGECDFIDPMCGSGTIPIEATLIARNIAPGIFRKKFAFENWKDFDEDLLTQIYDEDTEVTPQCKIYASDISIRNIAIAKENARQAGLKDINFQVKDFAELAAPSSQGLIMMNPPYGERMKPDQLFSLYDMIGERLKHHFSNHTAWVLSYNKVCFDKIGLKPSVKIDLFNGGLECQFRKYELYSGSRKIAPLTKKHQSD